jgi:hypothetical protein
MSKLFAYIDPGTGSMLIQAIGGIALTVVVFFKAFRRKLFGMFSHKKTEDKSDDKPSK